MTDDKTACAELVQAWGFARDQGRWDDLLAIFHSGGEIAVSWFRGPFAEFVEHCKRGGPSKHLIMAPLVAVESPGHDDVGASNFGLDRHPALIPAAAITRPQISISRATRARNSSGVDGVATLPPSTSFC